METFETQISIKMDLVLVTIGFLLVFGFAFNWLVSYLNRKGYSEGYTALLVILGTAITLLGAGFTIGWQSVAILFIYFAASGLFMVIGDIVRYVKARENE